MQHLSKDSIYCSGLFYIDIEFIGDFFEAEKQSKHESILEELQTFFVQHDATKFVQNNRKYNRVYCISEYQILQ